MARRHPHRRAATPARVLTMAASSSALPTARLPMPFFMFSQTPSGGVEVQGHRRATG